MTKSRVVSLVSRRSLVAMVIVSLVGLSTASAAVAHEPTGEYAVFNGCPLGEGVEYCLFAQTTSGEFKIGNSTVPIEKTITLQGGYTGSSTTTIVPAAKGETLSKAELTVPGGLLGILPPESLPEPLRYLIEEYLINKGPEGVTATAELVGTAKVSINNIALEERTGLTLPLRVHLKNLFLGGGCYIGSASNPVTLKLTSGETSPPEPNMPIFGKTGTVTGKESGNITLIVNNALVDNSFSAPAAEGCGGLLSFLVDPVLNEKEGLPAASGHNTAILNNTVETGYAPAVKKNEEE